MAFWIATVSSVELSPAALYGVLETLHTTVCDDVSSGVAPECPTGAPGNDNGATTADDEAKSNVGQAMASSDRTPSLNMLVLWQPCLAGWLVCESSRTCAETKKHNNNNVNNSKIMIIIVINNNNNNNNNNLSLIHI